MIRATAELGIDARREAGKTGIWVGETGVEEKLAAIGVHISRWVTSHGFAYNVSTDLRNFELIVPCGIASHGLAEFRTDRALRDCEPQSHVAREIAGAQRRGKGSRAEDCETSGRIARDGDAGNLAERTAGETGARGTGR